MKISKREGWEKDQGAKDLLFEITTCMVCPDSDGFFFIDEQIKVDKPVCTWDKKEEILIPFFPLIPVWCPRLESVEPDLVVGAGNPEEVIRKYQCWKNLSQEAKLVLKTLFELPEELISKQKEWVKSFIGNVIRKYYPWSFRSVASEKIYNELKKFTHELM